MYTKSTYSKAYFIKCIVNYILHIISISLQKYHEQKCSKKSEKEIMEREFDSGRFHSQSGWPKMKYSLYSNF